MLSPEWSFLFAIAAGCFDVGANLASTKSEGFTKRNWGVLSIALVLVAFAFLAKAAQGLDLAVAYGVLGATGIFGTAIFGRILFGQRLNPIGWIGLLFIAAAVLVLHT